MFWLGTFPFPVCFPCWWLPSPLPALYPPPFPRPLCPCRGDFGCCDLPLVALAIAWAAWTLARLLMVLPIPVLLTGRRDVFCVLALLPWCQALAATICRRLWYLFAVLAPPGLVSRHDFLWNAADQTCVLRMVCTESSLNCPQTWQVQSHFASLVKIPSKPRLCSGSSLRSPGWCLDIGRSTQVARVNSMAYGAMSK